MYTDQFEIPRDKHVEDPNFIYRWCNVDDRGMVKHKANGYEPVYTKEGEADVLIRRGSDLALFRIPRTAHAETVGARRRELQQQHRSAIDSAVSQVEDEATSAVQRATGTRGVRGLAFKTDPGPFKK